MNVFEVPFAAHNGIEISDDNTVLLPAQPTSNNHLAYIHAGAQYLLAESACGYYLLTAFPELVGRVQPLLRESEVKYHHLAQGSLTSEVLFDIQKIDKFLKVLKSRHKAVIELSVNLRDCDGELTCSGRFRWFVQLSPSIP